MIQQCHSFASIKIFTSGYLQIFKTDLEQLRCLQEDFSDLQPSSSENQNMTNVLEHKAEFSLDTLTSSLPEDVNGYLDTAAKFQQVCSCGGKFISFRGGGFEV